MRHSGLSAALMLLLLPACVQAAFSTDSIRRGQYLARAGDCIACHTRPGGAAYAGGLPFDTPVGRIYATNITPDRKTGIGNYSYDQFARAVREGVAANGDPLYPAMPYPSYASVSDADMRDLYAFFMAGVPAVSQPNRGSDIPWPLSMRWPLKIWNWLFVDTRPYRVQADRSAAWNRGAYLVEGLAHCGSCHTPRGLAYQEKALSARDGSEFLAGNNIGGWFAKSLRGDKGRGLGDWSEADIVEFLKTGRNDKSAAFGGMAEVIEHSSSHLERTDLAAVATYLKALPASAGAPTVYSAARAHVTRGQLRSGDYRQPGASTYVEFCASCHRDDGGGFPRIYPALAGNSVLLTDDTRSLIRIVLEGGRMPHTVADTMAFAMPGLPQLNNRETAEVLSFIRSSWGNHASAVSEADVATVRESLEKSHERR